MIILELHGVAPEGWFPTTRQGFMMTDLLRIFQSCRGNLKMKAASPLYRYIMQADRFHHG
jgi:hypothetical protein